MVCRFYIFSIPFIPLNHILLKQTVKYIDKIINSAIFGAGLSNLNFCVFENWRDFIFFLWFVRWFHFGALLLGFPDFRLRR